MNRLCIILLIGVAMTLTACSNPPTIEVAYGGSTPGGTKAPCVEGSGDCWSTVELDVTVINHQAVEVRVANSQFTGTTSQGSVYPALVSGGNCATQVVLAQDERITCHLEFTLAEATPTAEVFPLEVSFEDDSSGMSGSVIVQYE